MTKPLHLDIPQECFAKEPAQWEKNWVYWLFPAKAADQCEFRRHRIFAYSIQPFIMLGKLIFTMMVLLGYLLIGSRGFSLRYLLHPMNVPVTELLRGFSEGTYFFRKVDVKLDDLLKDNDSVKVALKHFLRRGWPLPLMPAWVMFATAMTVYQRWHIFLAIIGILVGIFILLFIIVMIAEGQMAKLFDKIVKKIYAWLDKVPPPRADELEMLVCGSERRAPKRTVKLTYYEVKSKVCKPFAR